MSLKKVQQVKKDKLFRLWDILIYGIIIAVIVVLFVVFVFTSSGGTATGIEVYYDNVLAFSYSFETDEYEIYLEDNISVEEDSDDVLIVIFCTDDGSLQELVNYNLIEIDKTACTASVTEADCSNSKECVNSPAIPNSFNLPITCVIHRLVVTSTDYTDDGETLIIG